MKRIQVLLFLLLFLSGCATYKFQKGQPPYDKGYVVSRDNYTVLEYTLGKDNSVPDLEIAKERFKRRRSSVEYYYKKIGSVENRFKQIFWDYPVLILKFVGGVFRLPFIAVADYKYEHDPQYREKVRLREEKEDLAERERIKSLKEELNKYIQSDLSKEASQPAKQENISIKPAEESVVKTPPPVEQKIETVKPVPPEPVTTSPVETEKKPAKISMAGIKPEPKEEKAVELPSQEAVPVAVEENALPTQAPEEFTQQKKEESERVADEWLKRMEMEEQAKELSGGCQAIIIAKPIKGSSPLMVKFNGLRSRSPAGKIISYHWEFGDGDTSTKPNPTNTYWSTAYGSRYFTVTLTVEDNKGNIAASSRVIEVINK